MRASGGWIEPRAPREGGHLVKLSDGASCPMPANRRPSEVMNELVERGSVCTNCWFLDCANCTGKSSRWDGPCPCEHGALDDEDPFPYLS